MSTTDWVSNLKINEVFHRLDTPMEYMVTALPNENHKTYRVASNNGGVYDIGPVFIRINCAPGPLEKPMDWTQKSFASTTLEAFAQAQLCDFPAAVREQVYHTLVASMTLAYERGVREATVTFVGKGDDE